MAKDAAEFLIWAQKQADSGVYPFPAAHGTSKTRAMEVATRFFAKAERAGTLQSIVPNGWAFDDAGDGGLQFNNGECGSAILDLYELTMERQYLESALQSADWAAARPLCPNWNHNSFSVFLLANFGMNFALERVFTPSRTGKIDEAKPSVSAVETDLFQTELKSIITPTTPW